MAAAFPEADEAVLTWFCEQQACKVSLSGKVLQPKTLELAFMLGHVGAEDQGKKNTSKRQAGEMFWMHFTRFGHS